jgi:hypothetical protein
MVEYVQFRIQHDFFFEGGNVPGKFAQVLRAAGQRLQRSIAA